MTSFLASSSSLRYQPPGFLLGFQSDFFSSLRPSLPSSSTQYSASAGALVRPGLSMPPNVIKPGADAWMTKSPVLPTARKPVKLVITLPNGMFLTYLALCARMLAMPCAVVSLSSLSVSSSAVGPSMTLPPTVAVTKIPLPLGVGVENSV